MEKKDNSLIFTIESNDITSFRASVNEIISFGKVVDQTIHISENF
jgi:tRNA threonylcarbamoyladenosine modification (KEOPS) complex  Pcc1 subunit